MDTFFKNHDAASLNAGILDTIKSVDNSILSIGLGLVRIKTEKLYRELGFRNMTAYVFYLTEQSKRNRSSIFKWLQIGEIYIKHKVDLEATGFGGNDSPTKLPYLERALRGNPKDEVFNNIKGMTQRAFTEYAKNEGADPIKSTVNAEDNNIEKNQSNEIVDNWGHSFYYKGKESVRVYKNLPQRILKMLVPAIRLSFNALDKRSYVVAVHLDNYKEYIQFQDIAIAAREKMRDKMRSQIRRRM